MKPDKQQQHQRLDQLLARLVDETISNGELVELESILNENEAAQERYLHYLGLHEDLQRKSNSFESTTQQGIDVDSTGLSHLSDKIGWRKVVSIAALFALTIGLAVFFLRPDPNFAKIVDYGGPVKWTEKKENARSAMEAGLPIGNGVIETAGAESWVEIEFADGTRLQLSGIASLAIEKFDSQKHLRLSGGSLSIDARPQPSNKPLRVITSSAEVEVLGTQFNVFDRSFSTRLEVNEGLVRVKRLVDGQIEEVKPDHEIDIALEAETEFTARQRVESTFVWDSNLTRDLIAGHQTENGTVRALTHLWRGDKKIGEKLEKPILLHSIVLDPSASGLPRVKAQPGQRFLLRGRTREKGHIHIGIATNQWNGGFAGKFAKFHPVAGSDFDIELSLAELKRTKQRFASLPHGQEIIYIWVQSIHKDIGLEIESVRLIP